MWAENYTIYNSGTLRDKTKDDKLVYNPYYYKQNFPLLKLKLLVEKCNTGTQFCTPTNDITFYKKLWVPDNF